MRALAVSTVNQAFRLVFHRIDHRDPRRRRLIGVIQGGVTSLGNKLIGMVISFLSVPLTIGYLGIERYGVWVTLGSLIAWMALTDFGLGERPDQRPDDFDQSEPRRHGEDPREQRHTSPLRYGSGDVLCRQRCLALHRLGWSFRCPKFWAATRCPIGSRGNARHLSPSFPAEYGWPGFGGTAGGTDRQLLGCS